jgi:hypothetical protein
MLSGMGQGLLDGPLRKCADHRRCFHKVRSGPYYVKNVHSCYRIRPLGLIRRNQTQGAIPNFRASTSNPVTEDFRLGIKQGQPQTFLPRFGAEAHGGPPLKRKPGCGTFSALPAIQDRAAMYAELSSKERSE